MRCHCTHDFIVMSSSSFGGIYFLLIFHLYKLLSHSMAAMTHCQRSNPWEYQQKSQISTETKCLFEKKKKKNLISVRISIFFWLFVFAAMTHCQRSSSREYQQKSQNSTETECLLENKKHLISVRMSRFLGGYLYLQWFMQCSLRQDGCHYSDDILKLFMEQLLYCYEALLEMCS